MTTQEQRFNQMVDWHRGFVADLWERYPEYFRHLPTFGYTYEQTHYSHSAYQVWPNEHNQPDFDNIHIETFFGMLHVHAPNDTFRKHIVLHEAIHIIRNRVALGTTGELSEEFKRTNGHDREFLQLEKELNKELIGVRVWHGIDTMGSARWLYPYYASRLEDAVTGKILWSDGSEDRPLVITNVRVQPLEPLRPRKRVVAYAQ